jgi:O-succinylbenzoic acid--CoA ligase
MASAQPLVAIRLPPPEAATAIRSSWDARRAVLPLDPNAPAGDVRRTLDALRPTHLLDAEGSRRLEDGAGVASEVAAVVATSGTTGVSRGVELTWSGMEASALAVSEALGVGGGDRWLCCLPLHHIAGLALVARSWVTGAGLEVLPRFDPLALATAPATLVSLVPAALRRLLDAGADLRRFRRILVGGAPVPDELRRRPEAAGVALVTAYGLTETWSGVVHDGHPLAGVELRLGPREEIEVRGPMVMRGYRLDPAETAAAFDQDGWLRTGDVGAFGPDGRLRVVDRLGDMIITGGVNVSPTEVEAVLAGHPSIADVCVAGTHDDEWGERVVAYVVPVHRDRPPALAAIRAFAAEQLAGPKLPRQVVAVDEIPRTPSGKPLRRLLTENSARRGEGGARRRRSGPPPPAPGSSADRGGWTGRR